MSAAGDAQSVPEAQKVAGQSKSAEIAWIKGPPASLFNNAPQSQQAANNLQNARAIESSAQHQSQLDSAHFAPSNAHDDHIPQQAAQTEGQIREGSEESTAIEEKKSYSEAASSTNKTKQEFRSLSTSIQQSGATSISSASPLASVSAMDSATLGPPTGQMITLPPSAVGLIVVVSQPQANQFYF
ncbi:hypothetical protein WR25_19350 isoform B [Diploscapter pachys]|uniref:Uncharacterized protein n=1 Tax=Diploscapter pachys TaxID=2018661 RepID=A0A2A2L3X6_9BILA|nr:hypothetical protein WR25_19350 isoform A [Diploscapter pachys]PAV80858.1 hypothetical protein WR25_19350 isoform B [Diploscapter pachys]